MPDYYLECEDGFITLLQTLTPFFEHAYQVSDDDANIHRGGDNFVIVRPGAFPITRVSDQVHDMHWEIMFDLDVRFKEYKKSWDRFKEVRSAILNLLYSNPTLGDTPGVYDVIVDSREIAQYLRFSDVPDAKPNFIIQTMRAIVTQRVTFTGGEF
jgi:hypothetical protein